MDTAAFNEYLEKRYFDQLNYYEKTSGSNKKKYKNFQWILIILSTMTTILAALPSEIYGFPLKYVVVGTAAIVTILTAGLKTFQYQELWVNYRSTIEQLKPELYYYKFNVGDYGQAGVDKESLFVSRVEQILNKEHDVWPVAKKIKAQPDQDQQQNDELQNNLAQLSKEKLKNQQTDQPEEMKDTVPPDEPIEKTDDVTGENKNDETGNNNPQ